MWALGLEGRAAALGGLLSPLRVRYGAGVERDEVAADIAWPATQALAELLSASTRVDALNRAEADALLRRGGYDLATFESKGWLRWVLGRFELPMAVGVAIAGVEAGRPPQDLSESELQAIAPVRTRIYSHNDTLPRGSLADAERILSSYPGVPTLAELSSRGAIAIQDEEVVLQTRSDLWSALGDRIAATLWLRTGDLPRWIARVPHYWWINAPAQLPASQREVLLDAMLAAVEAEPDLVGWSDEADHIAAEENDPFVLLGILSASRSNSLRAVAESRVALTDWDAYIEAQTYWPTLFALARMAVGAGKLDLAASILGRDEDGSPREGQSLVPQLMLATARGDGVETVSVPPHGDTEHRDVIDFFRGLRELEAQPADAVATFEGFVYRREHLAESAVNLFSARLRVANELTDASARINAIASALGDWTATALTIPAADLRRVAADFHQNELYALFQLDLRADFWRKWHELSVEEQAIEAFVRLALAASSADEHLGEIILAGAVQFHGDPVPAWLDSLRADRSTGKTPVPALPSTPALPLVAPLSNEDLRAAVAEAHRRPIESRAAIFGSSPTGRVDDELLELHRRAALGLQRLEVSLGQLREEDKISDFMIALLNSASLAMGISIHSQDRGGLSGGDARTTVQGGVGERDWTVQADAEEIAVAEAMQLPAKVGDILHHLMKLLERYDRAGLPRAFMVLYVRDGDFDENVTAYREAVRSWATTDAALVGDIEDHPSSAAYVCILRTLHRRGAHAQTTVFHLLVRIPRPSRKRQSV
ncbi:MAG TPA: hypothetical protein VGM88_08310 [Kofleriaceae bacterium]|jgi:hypothetical protein